MKLAFRKMNSDVFIQIIEELEDRLLLNGASNDKILLMIKLLIEVPMSKVLLEEEENPLL
jgi:hypothetical protein